MAGYEYKDIFLEEVEEQIEILNNALLALEKEKDNIEHLHAIFRVTHTLKSSAAFVGLNDLSDFAHKVESLLQKIIDGRIQPETKIIDMLFDCFDTIKDYIGKFSREESIDINFSELDKQITEIIDNAGESIKPGPSYEQDVNSASEEDEEIVEVNVSLDFTEEEIENIVEEGIDLLGINANMLANAKNQNSKLYYVNVFLDENVKMKWVRGELIIVNLERIAQILKVVPNAHELKTDKFDRNLEAVIETNYNEHDVYDACDIDQVMYILVKEITEEHVGELPSMYPPAEQENITTQVFDDIENQPYDEDESDDSVSSDNKKTQKNKSGSNILSQSQSVRVSIEKLDSLLNLVGELAIVNSGFIEVQERFKNILGSKGIVNELKDKIESLSNIAKSLQEGIMQSRMVPIGFVMSRFNRLVRDLSQNLKKKVNLVMHGEDTELDKKIIDAIGEPLIHLVRNSIDHGLESEAERKKLGKPEIGTVELRAYQRGNHIMIEVSDDGKGLAREKIIQKALVLNLVTEQESRTLDNNQVYSLIFEPGFSTKTEVTDLSGRGMGMNIVKETVEQLNGSINVDSEVGKGSTFTLAFPLTMAIVPAILTSVSEEVFAIPLYNVFETLKVKPGEIETIDFKEVLRVRDEVIEVCHLAELVDGVSRLDTNDPENKIPVVVVEYDSLRIGIIVDNLIGKREIVTKSISHYFKDKELEGISGATILGNGKIALILDVLSLVKRFKTDNGSIRKFGRSVNISTEQNLRRNKEFMANEETEKQILDKIGISETAFKSICELYKIGISNASKNISKFLMSDVVISAPLVRIHKLEEYKKHDFYFGEGEYFISEMNFTDGAGGKFILVLSDESVKALFEPILGAEPDLSGELIESSIKETTNILGAGITNTLSNALNMAIYISTPTLHKIKMNDFFDKFLSDIKINNEYIWAILATIMLDKNNLEGKIYIVPDSDTFYKMKEAIKQDKELLKFIENVMV